MRKHMNFRIRNKITRLSQKVRLPRLYRLIRKNPVNDEWGFNRGLPIDRHYIEKFVQANKSLIQGKVLSIGDDYHAKKYSENLESSDILHVNNTPEATIVADLTNAPNIPSDSFDCILLIQTLQLIFNTDAAIETCQRILKPGGVIILTAPGITPLKDEEWNDFWCWSFTTHSMQQILAAHFPTGNIKIHSYGNIDSACGFLHGLGPKDLPHESLSKEDPRFPVIISGIARNTLD